MSYDVTAATNALADVMRELERAMTLHPKPQNSPHEGWAVIFEELDELWDEVKKKGGGRDQQAYIEAKQVAAMAIRYMLEVCPAD